MIVQDDFIHAIEDLIRKAPAGWMSSVCDALKGFPTTATVEFVQQHLPTTNNADLAFLATDVIKKASDLMSWESLSWTVRTSFASYQRNLAEQHIELLWSGPSPADQIQARRIDQALYDLIANAKHEILLVTFAAAKIERLSSELLKAHHRGVRICLILEFEQSSEGQLSYDAIKAFPTELIKGADIYCWPVEKRERNQAGRPGKLHAKVAIVDDLALISSANLTDDAFNRNLEVGLFVKNLPLLALLKKYFESLVSEGTLALVKT
ncbi:MAG: DISARM system phospholipase D-like protein DrmC [Burkholderiales bacterium]